ncbi:hypothetical protein UlMin_018980 [Ulmus minor]
MAVASSSSSSSSSTTSKKYDVFISLRGEDTRHNFTSHLCAALRRKKVEIYIDEDGLERGKEISPALLQAIQESKIAVIIFSENYGSSTWCLEELLEILRCREKNGLEIRPVFHNIDPSHVRQQKGSYKNAFDDHEKRFKDRMHKVLEWREALTKAANLSGWSSYDTRPESKLIETIVQDAIRKLKRTSSTESVEGLVGINERIKKIDTLLSINSLDVRMIGIWGTGGIGKTTLASDLYRKLFSQFEGYCFLSNVRGEWEKGYRKKGDLKNELLSKLLEEESSLNIPFVRLDFDKDRLHRKRVLIVLDDVSSQEQLESLVGDRSWFGLGSRIIITTRDLRLLKNRADAIYKVEELSFDEALHLFHLNATKKNCPIVQYKELSKKAVNYARGIPLALEVLMGSLFSYKSKTKWESILADLKNSPDERIQNVYKASYDGLTEKQKELFLDIAFFFKGKKRDFVRRVLDGCDFFDDTKIDDLVEKSLITISREDELLMHDLIQETGWEIVRKQSIKKPGKRSRLRIAQDVYNVFKQNKVSATVEGIVVDVSEIKELDLSPAVFEEASNLRLLKIYNSSYSKKCKLYLPKNLQFLPDTLRYLQWDEYPSKSLPSNFNSEKLVKLVMRNSQVEQLWNGVMDLPSLKVIDLSFSKHLTHMPDLSQAPNLEIIYLTLCTSLSFVPSHNFQKLYKLTHLYLPKCRRLENLPTSMCQLRSLKFLRLTGCISLKRIPELPRNLINLFLSGTRVEELAASLGFLGKLERLELRRCRCLKSLPTTICELKSLRRLYLKGCSSLEQIPELPKNLSHLDLSGTAIEQVPSSIGALSSLVSFLLIDCKRLRSLPTSICKLKSLRYIELQGCSKFDNFPEILEPMEILSSLSLSGTAVEELPSSIERLVGLNSLKLNMCVNLQSILELPYICILDAQGCTSLESVSSSRHALVKPFKQSQRVSYFNCFKLDQNACNNIIADAHLRFSSMAANATFSENYIDYGACICYPGSEIPEWFAEHQTTISSINIKLPGNWRSSNCLGFSICFVVECNEYTCAWRAFRCEFHLRAKYGESRKLETSLWTSSDNGVEGTQILNSDHVFLCYKNPYSWALACKEAEEITEMSFHIYPSDLWTESFDHGDSCKVKKCGIRLLSPEDAKEFGLATNPDYWNSYKEDDDATSNCTESSDEEPIGRGLDGSVAEREDHQTHCSKSEIIDVEDYESKEEENGESVPSRIIACGSVIKEENVLNGSEIVLESSVTEQEEDKQSQSATTEKDEEEDPRSVSHGCLLFLSLFKGKYFVTILNI